MKRHGLVRYLLLLGWMYLIFRASATPDLRTVPWAQRFGFLPATIGKEATDLLELLLRKSAHMLSFAILALLAHWALAGTFPGWTARRRGWTAFLFAVLYALSDEWHQTFVPTRHGALRDVAIDAVGAALALLVLRLRFARQRRSGPPLQEADQR